MTFISVLATPGAQAFDTDTVLTQAQARALAAQGYVCAIRYVSRTSSNAAGDISASEAQTIIEAGLGLMLVQHCPPAYWTPTAAVGTQYGAAAAANASSVGCPRGATLWLDLENTRPGCGDQAIIAYVNSWCRAVAAARYLPGLYFSVDCPLTSGQIYLDLIVTQYWRSLSADTPAVAVRGPCMQQFVQYGQVAGIDIDRDGSWPTRLAACRRGRSVSRPWRSTRYDLRPLKLPLLGTGAVAAVWRLSRGAPLAMGSFPSFRLERVAANLQELWTVAPAPSTAAAADLPRSGQDDTPAAMIFSVKSVGDREMVKRREAMPGGVQQSLARVLNPHRIAARQTIGPGAQRPHRRPASGEGHARRRRTVSFALDGSNQASSFRLRRSGVGVPPWMIIGPGA